MAAFLAAAKAMKRGQTKKLDESKDESHSSSI